MTAARAEERPQSEQNWNTRFQNAGKRKQDTITTPKKASKNRRNNTAKPAHKESSTHQREEEILEYVKY